MACEAETYKRRFPDEICDYCHVERVVITDFRLTKRRDPAGEEWAQIESKLRSCTCTCSPNTRCRDKMCDYYKKQKGHS